MAAFALLAIGIAGAPTWWAALPRGAAAGACWLAVFCSTNAAIQLLSPDGVRGRLLALYLWLLVGPMALSGLAVGWLAEGIGIRLGLRPGRDPAARVRHTGARATRASDRRATPRSAPVSAQRLQHVSVQVPRELLDACARFYDDVLGMERIPNLAGAVWFCFGDEDHLHLLDGRDAHRRATSRSSSTTSRRRSTTPARPAASPTRPRASGASSAGSSATRPAT